MFTYINYNFKHSNNSFSKQIRNITNKTQKKFINSTILTFKILIYIHDHDLIYEINGEILNVFIIIF